jgi:chaperonin GroEL
MKIATLSFVQSLTFQIQANNGVIFRAYSGKDVRFGEDARQTMLVGVRKLVRAVATTLGPKGRCVVIANKYGSPKSTKDGVSVAKSIEFSNPLENVGAQLVRTVASKTNDQAGDGTTTASVLTLAIFEEGVEKVAGGLNPMDIYRGVQKAVDFVLDELSKLSQDITSKEQILQVATGNFPSILLLFFPSLLLF